MPKVTDFLSPDDESAIIDAIVTAEKNTSGEIRVHLEAHCDYDHYKRATEVFHALKMDNTKDANGVLIYIAVTDRKFVICGDKEIDRQVPQGFWDSTKSIMEKEFRAGNFKQGIIGGILRAGQELEKHFPWHKNDTNELSNEISKG